MRAQVPRIVTTRLPATFELPSAAFMYWVSRQPRDTFPVAVLSVWMGTDFVGSFPSFEFCHVCVAVGVSVTTAPGNDCFESTAATLSVRWATEGEPTMYGTVRPALPAEATTMTPAFSAVVEAIASADWSVPKSEPSDMLTTCMSCSTAHSRASTTTLVLPWQPNTRTAYRSALGATPG